MSEYIEVDKTCEVIEVLRDTFTIEVENFVDGQAPLGAIDREELRNFVKNVFREDPFYNPYTFEGVNWGELAEWLQEDWCDKRGLYYDQFGE